ncbi:MAG: sigma 54-interacting transcriptional regulator [Clostridia bacterium]|nr:sigma 54-interacting transcriptional regulator [Clostridia bacterium]
MTEGKISSLTANGDSKLLLQTIIDSLSDAVSVVDEKGIGIMINRAYTRITGMSEEQVLKKPATVDIAEGESVHLRVLQTGKPIKGVRMKVGPFRREVIVSCAPLIINGELKGSVGVIHDISELRRVMEELERTRRLIRKLETRYTFDDIIGSSDQIRDTIERAAQAAATPVCVLLRGECGTGKELFAHAIHHVSERAEKPLIRVNCASLTDTLLESELFGYSDGAFTGAKKGGRKGYFEEASGGTLFLDEIGAMSLEAQSRLLRAIQEGEIIRVGESRTRRIDVRVIAATNADLEKMVEKELFRKDLYYRLNVFPIEMPPLREIKSDIPLLVNHCLSRYAQEFGRTVIEATPAVYRRLKEYDWPGNIRELQNIIARALINLNREENIIDEKHLTMPFINDPESCKNNSAPFEGTLKDMRHSWEKAIIRKAMLESGDNKAKAARRLDISIRNLYNKLHLYKLL